MLGIIPLKAKLIAGGVILAVAFLLIKGFFGWLQDQQETIIQLSADKSSSETLRTQCNVNVRQMNYEIALHANITAREQAKRDKLMEELDVYRRPSVSRTKEVRAETQVAIRGHDCAVSDLPLDVIRMSKRPSTASG